MANFDFSTPITSDITLKAAWCCQGGGEPEYDFKGDWFRVTLSDGSQYVPLNWNDVKRFVSTGAAGASATLKNVATGATSVVSTKDVTVFEFGKGWERYTGAERQLLCYRNSWSKLQKIVGYPEGLGDGIPSTSGNIAIFSYLGGGADDQVIEKDIRLPSSILKSPFKYTLVGGSLIGGESSCGAYDRYTYGKIYFDFSPQEMYSALGINKSDVKAFFLGCGDLYRDEASTEAAANNLPYYKNGGVGIGGEYASQWLEEFPPVTPPGKSYECGGHTEYYLRKVYKI